MRSSPPACSAGLSDAVSGDSVGFGDSEGFEDSEGFGDSIGFSDGEVAGFADAGFEGFAESCGFQERCFALAGLVGAGSVEATSAVPHSTQN